MAHHLLEDRPSQYAQAVGSNIQVMSWQQMLWTINLGLIQRMKAMGMEVLMTKPDGSKFCKIKQANTDGITHYIHD